MTDPRSTDEQKADVRFAVGADATREALGLTWEEFGIGMWSEAEHAARVARSEYQRGYDTAGAELAAARTQLAEKRKLISRVYASLRASLDREADLRAREAAIRQLHHAWGEIDWVNQKYSDEAEDKQRDLWFHMLAVLGDETGPDAFKSEPATLNDAPADSRLGDET